MLRGPMPILRGSVTYTRHRAKWPGEAPRDQKRLAKALRGRGFQPIDRSREEDRAVGFVELEATDSAEFGPGTFLYGEFLLFGWRVDQLRIPASLVRAELERWVKAFERDKGRAPSKREKADGKAAIAQLMRSKAEPKSKVFDVSWNLQSGEVLLWTSSRKVADELQQAIEQSFEVELAPLVPAAVAADMEIADAALGPTPELCGPALATEVEHGQA
ncbi:MAG: recombination-associated protein RdgC [Myxococcales bacterium]